MYSWSICLLSRYTVKHKPIVGEFHRVMRVGVKLEANKNNIDGRRQHQQVRNIVSKHAWKAMRNMGQMQ